MIRFAEHSFNGCITEIGATVFLTIIEDNERTGLLLIINHKNTSEIPLRFLRQFVCFVLFRWLVSE